MTEAKDPSKDALSRALGAAFLSHKVEELEKTYQSNPTYGREKKDRRISPTLDSLGWGRGGRGRNDPGRPQRGGRPQAFDNERKVEHINSKGNESANEKDADVVIVDSSVLVHALGQLKAWSKYGREETVIVPLEALNTLDLLKKGNTVLAQRARAASRILEQLVGTNPRIKVQQDDAFVLWDDMAFALDEASHESEALKMDSQISQETPEWLRRTISCARWELSDATKIEGDKEKPKSVVIAVCTSTSPTENPAPAEAISLSSPVPLPAPSLPSKFEQRCAGTLVSHWAKAAGLSVLDVKATVLPPQGGAPGGRRGGANHARTSSDEEWRGSRKQHTLSNRGIRGGLRDIAFARPTGEKAVYGPGRGGETLVERPAATVAMNATMHEPAKVIRVLARGEKLDP